MAEVPEIAVIKHRALARGREQQLPYAGALLPAEAHALMRQGARLIDVRTRPEAQYVGRVPGSVLVEWQTYPGNAPNRDFLAQLAAVVEPGQTLLFLCRSGARSATALKLLRKAGLPWVQG